ncbi:uncharacterized protein J5F26_003053 [Ciconia maguari]
MRRWAVRVVERREEKFLTAPRQREETRGWREPLSLPPSPRLSARRLEPAGCGSRLTAAVGLGGARSGPRARWCCRRRNAGAAFRAPLAPHARPRSNDGGPRLRLSLRTAVPQPGGPPASAPRGSLGRSPGPGGGVAFLPKPRRQAVRRPFLLTGQRRVLAAAMACLTGLDGRRDGSSSIRQPEPKLKCSIHCSHRGKAARRGCFSVFQVHHLLVKYHSISVTVELKRSIWTYKAVRKKRDQAIQILKASGDETELLNSVHPKQRTESSATVFVDFPHKDRCASVL